MLDFFGGPDRDRTGDLFHAMEARSQLRHRPTKGRTSFILLEHAKYVKRYPTLPSSRRTHSRRIGLRASLPWFSSAARC